MPAEPAFIMGVILGVIVTLLVQAYGRRKAKKSDDNIENSVLTQVKREHQEEIAHLKDRIVVMERIVTDEGTRVSKEIAQLR